MKFRYEWYHFAINCELPRDRGHSVTVQSALTCRKSHIYRPLENVSSAYET